MLNYFQNTTESRFLTVLFLSICFSLFNNQLSAQELRENGGTGKQLISGTIMSKSSLELVEGATIKIGSLKTKTDRDGKFFFTGPFSDDKVSIQHVGFRDTVLSVIPFSGDLEVLLEPNANQIEEVEVISTGYQSIPKERTTGSFAHVDAKTLQRNPGMDLLSRLNGVTNGLYIGQNTGNPDGISVRGRSTLFSSTRPLIVIDNFPYEGDLDNINPNDVESVTVLKDATAASIWGVRSGNGVIVITTKNAKDRLSLEFSSNYTIAKKPDLFYEKYMSSSDFIDSEIWLFNQDYFDKDINLKYEGISPVVEILEQIRSGKTSTEEGHKRIDSYRTQDVRQQLGEFFYRNKFQHQQYVRLSSGTAKASNVLSVGFDRSLSDQVSSHNDRWNIRSNNSWNILKERLKVNMEIAFVKNKYVNGNTTGYRPLYPYEKLEENGMALEASSLSSLRPTYTDTAGNGYLLDWKYRPLDEVRGNLNNYEGKDAQLRFQFGLEGRIYRSFTLKANYLNSNNWMENSTTYDQKSYYSRNLVNQFSQINEVDGIVTRPIPIGDILNKSNSTMGSHYGRLQLDFNENIGTLHQISGLLGMEWRQDRSLFEDFGYRYGYNRDLETFAEVDIFSFFPLYHTGKYSRINSVGSRKRQVDNNRSWYGLFSYTYADNLTLTGSVRKDASNIFGVSANQKGIPLWSVGASYGFHDLLEWSFLDRLKVRTTYGYNGNVDKNTTAFLTARLYRTMNLWGKPIDMIMNPPNNFLRWERIENFNVGVDLSLWENRVGGSIDYFLKNGKDLMGHSPIAPQTGVSEFYGNVASTSTKGLDVQLWFDWFKNKNVKVRTDLIFNSVKDKVTDYYIQPGSNTDIVTGGSIVPIVGNPINSIILYTSRGLNDKGDPMGWVDGEISKDYGAIINGLDPTSIELMGSAVPTHFGSIRNTVSYQNIELSFQILYKWGNYIRRLNSLNSNGLIDGAFRFADYHQRWQNPGDEKFTQVPRFNYPMDINREEFYQNSSVLGTRGDLVRLQDVRLSYTINPIKKHPNSNLQLYMYAANLGLLWVQNDFYLDPDVPTGYPAPAEISLGAKFNF